MCVDYLVRSLRMPAFTFVLTLSFCVITAKAQSDPLPSWLQRFEPTTRQLPPGKTPGTFRCTYGRAVGFTGEPVYPVKVSFGPYGGPKLGSIIVSDNGPFVLEADLAPGNYTLYSEPDSPAGRNLYWGVHDAHFIIDEDGKLVEKNGGGPVILHQQKMKLLAPAMLADVAEARPTLRWEPLPGAVRYDVSWLENVSPDKNPSGSGRGKSTTSEFTFTEDVKPGTRYEWSVRATDETGQPIGYYSSGYFFTPGAREVFLNAGPVPVTGSRLGLVPDRSIPGAGPPGIQVMTVSPNSPASRAGLKADDVLTSFNGANLSDMSVTAFVTMVRKTEPGRAFEVEFVRKGERQKAAVTLEPASPK